MSLHSFQFTSCPGVTSRIKRQQVSNFLMLLLSEGAVKLATGLTPPPLFKMNVARSGRSDYMSWIIHHGLYVMSLLHTCTCARAWSVVRRCTPLWNVPKPRKCTVPGHGAERSHWPNKLDFRAEACSNMVRLASVAVPWVLPLRPRLHDNISHHFTLKKCSGKKSLCLHRNSEGLKTLYYACQGL